VVLLHLLSLALDILNKRDSGKRSLSQILTLYFELKNSFPEVTSFVKHLAKSFNLNLVILGEFKEGLGQVKERYPARKSIFMGTRRNDPHGGNLEPFSPTSAGWPEFMRINILLEWRYHAVWTFIRHFSLSYCTLYDEGYTSLGVMHNTAPNPRLAYVDSNGITRYHPAYMLDDESFERSGRPDKSDS